MQKRGYVYILASKKGGTLYIGVTSDLVKRVFEHKEGQGKGFTKKYNVKYLVYFEVFEEMVDAIKREKQLKNWKRNWKIQLLEKKNPGWDDLYPSIL